MADTPKKKPAKKAPSKTPTMPPARTTRLRKTGGKKPQRGY